MGCALGQNKVAVVEIWIFFKIPFSNHLKVFYLHLELPND